MKTKLIKYLIVDPQFGLWNWNPEEEHHSVAVPKMVNHLEIRVDKVMNELIGDIKNAFAQNLLYRMTHAYQMEEKIDTAMQELNLHLFMLREFKTKVVNLVSSEDSSDLSPILKLKQINTPLLRTSKNSLTQMYEHIENNEIVPKIEGIENRIEGLLSDISIAKECYKQMNDPLELDANYLLNKLRNIRNQLENIGNEDIFNVFFAFDDATRGLIKRNIIIKVNLIEAADKIYDYIFRNLLKAINNYKNSKESESVSKAIERLRDLGIDSNDLNLQVLLETKTLLEVEAKNPSLAVCYKKIGELHSNFHQKKFEFSAIKYLRKYFAIGTILLVDIVSQGFEDIYNQFCNNVEDETNNEINNEIKSKVIQELLLEAEDSKVHFFLNKKLHIIHQAIAAQYGILNENKLECFLKLFSSDQFYDFLNSTGLLIMELRNELKKSVSRVKLEVENNKALSESESAASPRKEKTTTAKSVPPSPGLSPNLQPKKDSHSQNIISSNDLIYIGRITGKTSMIDSYNKAVEEISASLGTFMANIKMLIREMLQNLPPSKKREALLRNYENIQTVLTDINRNSFDDSEASAGDTVSSED